MHYQRVENQLKFVISLLRDCTDEEYRHKIMSYVGKGKITRDRFALARVFANDNGDDPYNITSAVNCIDLDIKQHHIDLAWDLIDRYGKDAFCSAVVNDAVDPDTEEVKIQLAQSLMYMEGTDVLLSTIENVFFYSTMKQIELALYLIKYTTSPSMIKTVEKVLKKDTDKETIDKIYSFAESVNFRICDEKKWIALCDTIEFNNN